VESADGYARRLEHNVEEAKDLASRFYHALTQCEASLAASWETINQERLDHRASQEALTFERERHKETMELLEQVFREAVRSGEIADSLSSQVATLQAASNSGIIQAFPQAMASAKASLGKESSILSEASPETCASRSSRPKHSDQDERQLVAHPLHDAETQSSITGSAIEGAGGHKRSKATKKRTSRPAAKECRLTLSGKS
jgi:hypothetical protein